jgi:hypothetical protein
MQPVITLAFTSNGSSLLLVLYIYLEELSIFRLLLLPLLLLFFFVFCFLLIHDKRTIHKSSDGGLIYDDLLKIQKSLLQ